MPYMWALQTLGMRAYSLASSAAIGNSLIARSLNGLRKVFLSVRGTRTIGQEPPARTHTL